jgi:hypothetical protein
MARRPGAIAWCLQHPAVSRPSSYRAWPLEVLARAQRDGGAPAQGGWAGAPLVGAVAVSVRWEPRSAIKGLGWLVQLGWWTDICRSVQLKGWSGRVGGLQAAKVWIWALTVLGLAGPWSRTTRYTVAWRASSRVVSLPIT